jgi:hypothetical protein
MVIITLKIDSQQGIMEMIMNGKKEKSAGVEKLTPGKKDVILVIGDWFIDENWLMAKSTSYHSYNVGDEHYVSLMTKTDSAIMSLCGAASIMRLLNGSPEESSDQTPGDPGDAGGSNPEILKNRFELVGIGSWNPRDNDLLQCILCPQNTKEKIITPFRLSGLKHPKMGENNKKKCPYSKDWKDDCKFDQKIINIAHESNGRDCSTNRLVRVYEGFGSDQPTLRYRYDWQIKLKPEHKDYSVLEQGEENKKIDWESVKAVILVDHGYGVIDEELIEKLLTKTPKSKWYVRSKLESPAWLKFLMEKKKTLRLIFTDEQLLNYKYCTRIWQHGMISPGRGILELIGELSGLPVYKDLKQVGSNQKLAENVAILFDNDTAFAATRLKEDDARLINISNPQGQKMPIRVGRSSVFFASLIYWDLMCSENIENNSGDPMGKACSWSLENAYNWTKDCTEAWLEEDTSELSGPFEHAIYRTKNPITQEELPEIYYKKSWDEWNDSSKELGIVNGQIQLWRAFGTLKNYISAGGRKRTEINALIHSLYHYTKHTNPTYPFNCLLLAEPGWGKSFLAKCLANYFDFEFLSFSIAQMASNKDLIDSFKVIASTQNRTKKRVLVFMDEIDAQIESHYAMGLMLSPIWDGFFKIEGNIYNIAPCIWVFASTKSTDKLIEGPKGRDFLSRINGPILDLDFLPGKERNSLHEPGPESRERVLKNSAQNIINLPLRTELVYHGVNFLNRLFGPIAKIDESVLKIFHEIMPVDGIRSLEIFVSKFRDISRGVVTIENVPSLEEIPELSRHIWKLEPWPKKNLGEIRVLLDPPK